MLLPKRLLSVLSISICAAQRCADGTCTGGRCLSHFNVSLFLSPSLAIRENSRGHAHGLWLRKLANSASWHATVGDIHPFLLRRLHRLPHGYWAPQVRQLEVPGTALVSLQVCLSHFQSAFTPQLDLLTCQTQVSAGYC